MKHFFIIALTTLGIVSCANINANQRKGETFTVATDATQIVSELKTFEHLSVGSSLDVKFVQSDRHHIEIHGSEKDLRNINYTNENGIFDIWVNTQADKDGKEWRWTNRGHGKISITIYGKQLKSTNAHGASKITIDSLQCTNLKISNSGASTTNIAKLDANEVGIDNSGASITNITKLDAKGMDIGNTGASITNIKKVDANNADIGNSGASITNITKMTVTETSIGNTGASITNIKKLDANGVNIGNTGASSVSLSNATAVSFDVSNSGASKCDISGTAVKITTRCSGKSSVNASRLRCEYADVSISGESSASVYADKEIVKEVTSGSSCETRGSAKIVERK